MLLNTFHFKNYEYYKLDETNKDLLINVCKDGNKESHFRGSYSDFWAKILQNTEYKSRATIAVNKLVMMPTTYLAENGFSGLVEIKNKKRKRLKMVDELMRGALEEKLLPQIENISSTK